MPRRVRDDAPLNPSPVVLELLAYLRRQLDKFGRIEYTAAAYPQDKDPFPRRLAAVHPDTRAPHVAIVVHALAAALLATTGSFAVLAPIASIAIIVVYLGCCAAAWAWVQRRCMSAK